MATVIEAKSSGESAKDVDDSDKQDEKESAATDDVKAKSDEAQNDENSSVSVSKSPSSEDQQNSDDTGSSDAFVLADEGSTSPDRHADASSRASSVSP